MINLQVIYIVVIVNPDRLIEKKKSGKKNFKEKKIKNVRLF